MAGERVRNLSVVFAALLLGLAAPSACGQRDEDEEETGKTASALSDGGDGEGEGAPSGPQCPAVTLRVSTATIPLSQDSADTASATTFVVPSTIATTSGSATGYALKFRFTRPDPTLNLTRGADCVYAGLNASTFTFTACVPIVGVLFENASAGTQTTGTHFELLTQTVNSLLTGAMAARLDLGSVPLSDGNLCTTDACGPHGGATHTNVPQGTSCADSTVCNGAELCDANGACQPGTPLVVDDSNPCTADACDPVSGVSHTNLAAGTSCSDGNACNGSEVCGSTGNCLPGTPPPVDDNNVCTTDSCDPATGVHHTPVNIDDTNPCTTDACDPVSGVSHTILPAGTSCSDGYACDGDEVCDAFGTCLAGLSTLDPGSGCEPPALDPTIATSIERDTAFLYSGSTRIQSGVPAGAIDKDRVGVIRGRVLDTDGSTPKVGARITIVGHPEFGKTSTRADGWFDIAVNGGTSYAVNIDAAGYLTVQRRASLDWHGWAVTDDVVLTQPFTSADAFAPGSSAAQVVRGDLTPTGEDADDARRAVVYFPPNARFTNYAVADGTPLQVQLTEFTRGSTGPQKMPGELPTTSGYTYAFEAAIPAASAAGIRDVHFDTDIYVYVDNFTHFPVGTTVPLGYYDRAKGAWGAERSGRIIKILSVNSGSADLDVTGDGMADTGDSLSALGITATEQQSLASTYPVGTELWRVAISHFSAYDANWPNLPPDPTKEPPKRPLLSNDTPDKQCEAKGSIIGCEGRTLGESIAIPGTPFALRYNSERTRQSAKLGIRITDDSEYPSTLARAHIEIEALGRKFSYVREAPLTPNDVLEWSWDGLDAYGRPSPLASVNVRYRVGYEYTRTTTITTETFGALASVAIALAGGNRWSRSVTLWREGSATVRRADHSAMGFGGWTFSAQHLYDRAGKTVFHGSGEVRSAANGVPNRNYYDLLATGLAGGALGWNDPNGWPSNWPDYWEGQQATKAGLGQFGGIAEAPDGSVYIADAGGPRIRRVARDGTITNIAGVAPTSAKVDGMLALHARIDLPSGLAIGPDGSIYFSEYYDGRVWRIDPGPNPRLHLVAGNGMTTQIDCSQGTFCGDRGPATSAELWQPTSLAVAPDGTVFIAEDGRDANGSFCFTQRARVRRVGPEGTITTYVSNICPRSLSLRKDGTLSFVNYPNSTNHAELWEVSPYGVAQPIVNPASEVPLNLFTDVCRGAAGGSFDAIDQAIDARTLDDGSYLVSCGANVVLRTADGPTLRVAGQATSTGSYGDGQPALDASFADIQRLALRHGDSFLVAAAAASPGGGWAVRALSQRLGTPPASQAQTPEWQVAEWAVPSSDGGEVYIFSAEGRHARTVSGLTGATIYTLNYDANNQLRSVVDQAGNATTITRDGSTISIAAPFGQVTRLALDPNGYLASVTHPETSEVTQLAHDSSGLLTDFADPEGRTHHFDYDVVGRLVRDLDGVPGSPGTTLAGVTDGATSSVTKTSPEGRVTSYEMDYSVLGGDAVFARRHVTQGTLTTVEERSADASTVTTFPDGTRVSVLSMASDPRWGVAVSYPSVVQTDVGYPTPTHSFTRTESRTATLGAASDPFSVTSQTITTTMTASGLPDATSTRVFAAGSPATWTQTSAEGVQVTTKLDVFERVSEVAIVGTSPVQLHPVQFHYDGKGRVDSVTHGNRVFTASYDTLTGWLTDSSEPDGMGVSFDGRDANGRPTLLTLPGGRPVSMSYDRSGRIASIAPPGQAEHTFSWDSAGRLSVYAPPDLGFLPKDTIYSRDKDGLSTQVNQPDNPLSFTFDTIGRLNTAADAVTKTLGYDSHGRLETISTTDGVTVTNTYDGSILTAQSTTGPFSHSFVRTYDNFLRPSSWSIDGNDATSISYDRDGRVVSSRGLTISYSQNGLVTGSAINTISDAYTYSAFGEVVGYTTSGAASTFAVAYQRDDLGRIHLKEETIGAQTHVTRYEYDSARRLSQVFLDEPSCPHIDGCVPGTDPPNRAYSYDLNGNRSGGTYDNQDRLLAANGTTFEYGKNGELTRKTDTATSAQTVYTYDARGNLRHVDRPVPLAAIDYVIDGKNRRIAKKVGGGVVQGFVYDGRQIVAELDGNGSVTARFVYVTGLGAPDLLLKGGAVYRILKDHLGSPRRIVNVANGATAQQLDFDEWGNVIADTNPGFQPFGFAGGLRDNDTNLIRFGARDYDPSFGRWTTKDPSRFAGGYNFYVYCNNDPVNFVDSNGRVALALGLLVGGGTAGTGIVGAAIANPLVPLVAINVAIWGAVGYNAAALANEWDSDVIFADPADGSREARKGREREGDDTRGKTPEQIEEEFKGKKTPQEIKRMIEKAQKLRGERNKRKQGRKKPPNAGGSCGFDPQEDSDDEDDGDD